MAIPRLMILLYALALLLVFTGCATIAGPAGAYQGEITCKGKGVITFSGGPYSGTMQADCSPDGFEYSHHRERTKPAEK